jgi:hypothetical protein
MISLIKWLVYQELTIRKGFLPVKNHLVSHLSFGFLFVSIFHNVNGAIDRLNIV